MEIMLKNKMFGDIYVYSTASKFKIDVSQSRGGQKK